MRVIISTVSNLKVDINTILQCYIWQTIPEGLCMQCIHITNSNRCSLAQIESKIFEAAERYKTC